MKRTFSIFVSSVQKEFSEDRRALKDYITHDPMLGRFFPDVFLFEDLPAQDQRPDLLYLSEIEKRDLFLGIFGQKYGWKDADGLSPTAREFRHATHVALNKPKRLIFVKGQDNAGRDPEMIALIGEAGEQLTRRRFSDTPGLMREVYASLVEFLETRGLLRTPPFDSAPCEGADLRAISAANVEEFLRLAEERGRFHSTGARGPRAVLSHFHLLADGMPTQAAVFLFGRAPVRFLTQTQVHCLWFTGTEKRKPIDDQKAFDGTAFATIDAALQFVLDKLTSRVGLATVGAAAPVRPEIPVFAVREAIVNAVAHRDYTSAGFVQVIVFSDRVEVWNPGHLPAGLTAQDLRSPHGPVPHNPLIAEPLFRAGYAEKAGTGTTDMIEACCAAGLPEPDFDQRGPHFVVTLWRDWLTDEVLAGLGLSERQLKIIAHLKMAGRISNVEFQKLAGGSRRTALRELSALVKAGILLPVGSGRGAAYVLARKRAKNAPNAPARRPSVPGENAP